MRGHTLAEKLIASHVPGSDGVRPGDLVEVNVDVVLANDITAPISLREFESLGVERVFDPEKVVLVADHFAPNKDIKSAEQCKAMREFARAQGIAHHYDVGRMGIEHVLLHEQGLVLPSDVVVGADSHTCTYGALGAFATGMGSTDIAVAMATGSIWMRVPETIRFEYTGTRQPWVGGKDLILYTIGQIGVSGALYMAMEFAGPVVDALPMSDRFTMSNMAIEAGGKAGLFAVDDTTREYVAGRAKRDYQVYASDADAVYARVVTIDVSDMEPQVSFPHLPENAKPVSEAAGIKVDQAVIGSCTNGRLEDLRVAAQILTGRRVHPDVRCIVIPGTQQVYLDALREGLVEAFIEAGAVVSTPTCGPCLGGHMGILAAGERAVSTTNRNFRGRMGHPDSEVYLSGPAVAAASAIAGTIVHPEEVI
ncbi:MAG TPA: 3-isopropylmalate dehydratase large subunit [Anaerolineae bacterium]|nr:3-isopropylmalate dehydratase large subunit [Anaerolineae bacterium]HQI84085.1 3-isopropylmalate dehydratase large subunit [Anaerolineae bacterium]